MVSSNLGSFMAKAQNTLRIHSPPSSATRTSGCYSTGSNTKESTLTTSRQAKELCTLRMAGGKATSRIISLMDKVSGIRMPLTNSQWQASGIKEYFRLGCSSHNKIYDSVLTSNKCSIITSHFSLSSKQIDHFSECPLSYLHSWL